MPGYVILAADHSTIVQSGKLASTAAIQAALAPGQTYLELGAGVTVPRAGLQSYDTTTQTFIDIPVDPLPGIKAQRIKALTAICDRVIMSVFTSSALGSAYTYPAKDTDQANMGRVAIAGGKLWAKDSGGTWAMQAHTAAQGAQVLTDFGTACDAARTKLDTLRQALAAATAADAVNAVTWG